MFSFFLGAADSVTSVSHFANRSPSHAPHAFAAQLLGDSLKMLHRSILSAFSRRSLGRRLRRCSISGAASNTTFYAFGVLPIFFYFVIKNTTHIFFQFCHSRTPQLRHLDYYNSVISTLNTEIYMQNRLSHHVRQ